MGINFYLKIYIYIAGGTLPGGPGDFPGGPRDFPGGLGDLLVVQGTSLVVQGTCAFTAKDKGPVPGQATRSHKSRGMAKKKKKKEMH